MNKFLLSMALVAGAAFTAAATEYTINISAESPTWATQGDGFTATATVDGKTFTITTAKGSSKNDLVNPAENGGHIRVYQNSDITISSDFAMKTVIFNCTAEDKTFDGTATGWTVVADSKNKTVTSTNAAGANSFTFSATNKQIRIQSIVVSDEVISAPDEPVTPPADAIDVEDVAGLLTLPSDGTNTNVNVNFPLTVAFVNKSNIFCVDGANDPVQVYGANSYKVNDVIPQGWSATYKMYNGSTPELEPVGTLPAASGTNVYEPRVVTDGNITVADVNAVLLLKGVSFAEATPAEKANFTGTQNGQTLSFRNNYTLASVEAGTYDVKVVVTVYNNEPSIYVIDYGTNTGEPVTPPATSENGTEQNPLSVAEFLAKGIPDADVPDTYVKGYIVGYVPGQALEKAVFSATAPEGGEVSQTNIIIAGSSSETNYENCIPVQLPKGDVREGLNLAANPDNLGASVVLKGARAKYFLANGLKNTSWYTLEKIEDNRKDANIFFPETDYTATVGEAFEAPILYKTTTAEATYTSSNTDVATVDAATGAVTIISAGQTKITATTPANDEFKAGSTYYTLTVKNATDPDAIYSGVMSDEAQIDWSLDSDATMPDVLSYIWSWKEYNGAHYLNASAYKDGTPYAASAYAVSPEIDLTDYTDVTVNFEHAAKFQTNLRQDCGLYIRNLSSMAEITDYYENVEIPVWPEAGSWTFVNSGNIDLSSFDGCKIQIAFKYVSTDSAADTWEIRNLVVKGNKGSGVETIIGNDAEAVYYDLNGRMVKGNLDKGIYIKVQGENVSKIIVK